ncbi:alpha/beta fold hydrolase [Stigmatella aurantiaca]|nr:alpha/beta hydrolase [Stigmatella aurantiaca]EAU64809.1 ScmB [Stigmatella aurantiaca DW4/3-1]
MHRRQTERTPSRTGNRRCGALPVAGGDSGWSRRQAGSGLLGSALLGARANSAAARGLFAANPSAVRNKQGSPVLVFLHYWGGLSRTWGPVIERSSETSWGESSKEAEDYRLETLASDVVGIVGQLGLRDFIIVGHSMGGKVAQLVAAWKPAGLKRLILIAPAPPAALDVCGAPLCADNLIHDRRSFP